MATDVQTEEAPAPTESAREAGLRYTVDSSPGIRRRRAGKGFTYTGPEGRRIDDPETLARIRDLAVPPAWTDVWICLDPRGHLQATGRDARGRKQYRYHPEWRRVRDADKFDRLLAFGRSLPAIRKRIDRDLARPGLPRERVLAAVVRLLETTMIRVGNDAYARDNGSYGLTTLLDRHADVDGSKIEFRFRSKGGKLSRARVRDRRVAAVIKRSLELPGRQLFQYVDHEDRVQNVDSADVNDYLRDVTGLDLTSKDFRTWAGTTAAVAALAELQSFGSETEAKRGVVRAIEDVADGLGNTPAVCRKCYVHPAVIEAYMDGSLAEVVGGAASNGAKGSNDHEPEERAVLALLERRRNGKGEPRRNAA
jgi:DNA topoisomerase I